MTVIMNLFMYAFPYLRLIPWMSLSCKSLVLYRITQCVDLMKAGNTVIIRNAKIDMFKGSMRLAVDKWGRIEVTEPASFTVKEDNNLSLVEYELVNVTE
ncbi:nucleic acid-binding, OB-fold protein [Tanacetum coccineum]